MNNPHTNNLGEADLRRMQQEGWGLSDRGLKVGNGWLMWATNPRGNLEMVLVADPDDEPEKFPSLSAPPRHHQDGCAQSLLPF